MVSLQVLTGIGFQHDLYATLYTQNVKQGHGISIEVERITQSQSSSFPLRPSTFFALSLSRPYHVGLRVGPRCVQVWKLAATPVSFPLAQSLQARGTTAAICGRWRHAECQIEWRLARD